MKVEPKKNFRVKTGSLKAVIRDENGSMQEVYMSRKDDNTYTFNMPTSMNEKAKVTFQGEFEPGQNASDAYETSLGAGLAVTVANNEARADLKGNVTANGNIKVSAKQEGGVQTSAKAGSSKANIGLGGAIAVQVASMDAKARIFNTANLKLDGKLSAEAESNPIFSVNGDAAGNKEAGDVGVGAGIAVAVNGADAFAAIQDGVKVLSLIHI